jgi:hypothetical protein
MILHRTQSTTKRASRHLDRMAGSVAIGTLLLACGGEDEGSYAGPPAGGPPPGDGAAGETATDAAAPDSSDVGIDRAEASTDAPTEPAADAASDAPSDDAAQPPPTPIPIGFWCGPPDAFITPARYAEVAAAGYTFLMPPCEGAATAARNKKILDTAKGVGLVAWIGDERMPLSITGVADAKSRIDAIVADYAAHPALAGYYVTDEPSAPAFAGLGEVVAYLRSRDPAHPAYVNLLPNYATSGQLGAPTYPEHVEQFVAQVKPAILSYDHYHFLTTGDRPGFFDNLSVVRGIALKNDIPFWQIVLAVPHGPYRPLTEAEKRWEEMHTLVYGGKGVMDFTYWTPSDPIFGPAIIDRDGTPTQQYAEAQRIHADVQRIGQQLMGATSKAVFQSGALAPGGVIREPGATVLVPGAAPVTVGLFQGAAFAYALLVNRDYKATTAADAIVATGGATPQRLVKSSGAWKDEPGTTTPEGWRRLAVNIAPGDGELIRLTGSLAKGPLGAEVMVGTVRADAGTEFLVDSKNGVVTLGGGGWDSCFPGFTLVGHAFHSNGFWLCARSDLAASTFHVGNVVADHGYYYRVQSGTVTQLADASWDTCAAGALLGHQFESNGFWVCMQ